MNPSGLRRPPAVLLFLSGILLFAILGYGIFTHRWVRTDPLAGALLITRTSATSSPELFGISARGLTPISLTLPGALVDYDRGAITAAIMQTATDTQDIYLADSGKRLTADGGQKAFLKISPDGATIAYAQYATTTRITAFNAGPRIVTVGGVTKTEGVVGTTTIDAPFYSPANWVVKSVDVASGKTSAYGVGIGPQFFSRDGHSYVLYTSPEGIDVVDLADGSRETLSSSVIASPAYVSPDGAYLLLPTAGGYVLSSIAQLNPIRVALSATLPSSIAAAQFSGKAVFAATAARRDAKLSAYSFAGIAQGTPFTIASTTILRILPPL